MNYVCTASFDNATTSSSIVAAASVPIGNAVPALSQQLPPDFYAAIRATRSLVMRVIVLTSLPDCILNLHGSVIVRCWLHSDGVTPLKV